LQRIVLASNRISSLPGHIIACLISLKHIDLTSNQLSELPDELCQLQKLERLLVGSNSLRRLPDGCVSSLSGSCPVSWLTL
jgi:Leucine-rich repeat (LRR) protein